ncbi:hypothetical protein TNCV_97651 [Trichonephila clavipes]|nr:hypothetical protein TNCV_97651 [Trichonephila clavipes]
MQPLGVGGVDVRDFGVKNCYESSGRDWSARSAPIGGEKVCQKRMVFGALRPGDVFVLDVYVGWFFLNVARKEDCLRFFDIQCDFPGGEPVFQSRQVFV